MKAEAGGTPKASREAKWLFQMAIVVFLVTVVIGILNGLDLAEFDRPTLLTHVHTGTMGWITLAVLGATLWLFSAGAAPSAGQGGTLRWLGVIALIAVPIYGILFYFSEPNIGAIFGSFVLVVILGFFVWAVAQSRHFRLTTPHLALLAALATLTVGAVLGVLLQAYLGGSVQFLPEGAFASHGGTMVTGYLILAGMAITEWGLGTSQGHQPLSKAGIAQVALPFAGGISLLIGALLDIFPLILLIVPLQLAGTIIYLIRVGPRIVRARWREGGGTRLFGLSAVYLAINVGIIAYLIANYADRIEEIPSWLIFALDHSVFIGVMTYGLFGMIYEASRERRSFWPWADHVLFWGVSVGLVGFVTGLVLQEATFKQLFTPIMGVSILLAMLTYSVRLSTRPPPQPSPQ